MCVAAVETRSQLYRLLQYGAKFSKWALAQHWQLGQDATSASDRILQVKQPATAPSSELETKDAEQCRRRIVASLGRAELMFGDARRELRGVLHARAGRVAAGPGHSDAPTRLQRLLVVEYFTCVPAGSHATARHHAVGDQEDAGPAGGDCGAFGAARERRYLRRAGPRVRSNRRLHSLGECDGQVPTPEAASSDARYRVEQQVPVAGMNELLLFGTQLVAVLDFDHTAQDNHHDDGRKENFRPQLASTPGAVLWGQAYTMSVGLSFTTNFSIFSRSASSTGEDDRSEREDGEDFHDDLESSHYNRSREDSAPGEDDPDGSPSPAVSSRSSYVEPPEPPLPPPGGLLEAATKNVQGKMQTLMETFHEVTTSHCSVFLSRTALFSDRLVVFIGDSDGSPAGIWSARLCVRSGSEGGGIFKGSLGSMLPYIMKAKDDKLGIVLFDDIFKDSMQSGEVDVGLES
ncbi:unnamed protein product [Phytophthora fragariaefolia]|uniref:Unnamed protein product n=1 Tax=Phytophthora fragariaefolia TaxID=1490495 RepID=A0A9W6XNN1_9STRA|nr:unnamed protein product [Phytophthora fragariaefolia]